MILRQLSRIISVFEYYDAETGLHYNYTRDHHPAVGRYLEADLVGIQQGDNHLYVRVGNNPIRLIDPEGKGMIACLKSIYTCGNKCAKATKECKKKHEDILNCYDKGENIPGGSASGHLLEECYAKSPECKECVADMVKCGNFIPGVGETFKNTTQ